MNRTLLTVGLAGAVGAVGVVAALGLGGDPGDPPAPRRTAPAATTRVTRQTLVDAVTVPGVLGYGPATPITSTAPGTVTWLPDAGATVKRGGQLLRVDDRPIILLYGQIPMYRPLAEGTVGADVRQFEQNLAALGYRSLVVDDTFSPATTSAVKRWQKSLKLPETGVVERERVQYTRDAVRISRPLVRPGASAAADVLEYTGSTRVVTVTADRGKLGWAASGTGVELSAEGGAPVRGEVTAVTAALDPARPEGTDAVAAIAFADQDALGTAAGAAVTVRYIRDRRPDVLTVPVAALLALAEGGYGVEVAGDRPRIVAVRVGLFAEGRVEITGVDEGTVVGVPS